MIDLGIYLTNFGTANMQLKIKLID